MLDGTGIGHSFHVTTDVPIVTYEMSPYGGGSAAVTGSSLLLPVSAWDTNYVASTASPDTAGPPGITIIAAQDNTVVSSCRRSPSRRRRDPERGREHDGEVHAPEGPAGADRAVDRPRRLGHLVVAARGRHGG